MTSAASPLTIVNVRHWLIYIPFEHPIVWGSGKRLGSTRLVVEVTTAGGVKGYGETISLLDFVPAVFEKVVAPLLIGRSVSDVERFHRHVLGAGYYHHQRAAVMAMAAAEMAMWDALGRHAGLPLHALWGGAYRTDIELSAYLFVADPQGCADMAARFLDQGYTTFKLKIGHDLASDLSLVEAVRRTIGDDPPLRADVNGAWTPGTARRQLDRLKAYDLAYIEQPLVLDDLIGHAELRKVQTVPVALDESAYTLNDVGNIVRMGAADVILLDPHEQGGLWQCLKAAAIAEAAGLPVTLHSGGELGLSQAAYLHLAAAIPNMSIAIDTEYYYHTVDIIKDPHEIKAGRLPVPTGPGLGVTPDIDRLDSLRTTKVIGAYLDADRPGWFAEKPKY
ncbi:mandelate racemase/muconate lactonizing enzyme family protein [Microvirga mediterraneensis]|uniref:glucarate dehydratase n=1 Tax=Microvirga mediterraneensis TaxID=2754695 RepID=A0A838BV57_9HYPH|nr:mandelate racemase/muconate lactonizing enzyme family protein [Microvirga mediterraneensis]MBA1158376.1 mandelate racemase/muconate lactonizing enzyme family protein [Microvirga mediterraneensis]